MLKSCQLSYFIFIGKLTTSGIDVLTSRSSHFGYDSLIFQDTHIHFNCFRFCLTEFSLVDRVVLNDIYFGRDYFAEFGKGTGMSLIVVLFHPRSRIRK